KVDQYPAADRDTIYAALKDERLRDLISPEEIVMTAAAPLVAVMTAEAGARRPQIQRGQPQVEALKLKILEVLQREGLALVALNTLLYADELNDTIVQRKLKIRDQAAQEVIWNSVMTKAIAVALNPVTMLDVLTGAIVDVAMILMLSRLYGLPMTRAGAVQLLKSIAVELGGLSASELLVTLGLSSLKGVLGVSVPATGGLSLAPYTTVAITQATVVGVATYGIGLVTQQYLANGAKWGPDGPKPVVHNILEHLDEASILNRIKAEITVKLNRHSTDQSVSKPEI
ncbi:MAG: YcjF family protein, partial [Cyanobacteria bacterium J06607_6]